MKHKFMQAVRHASTPLYAGERYKDGIHFKVSETKDHVTLDKIRADNQNTGKGSQFMSWFTSAADQYGITLRLQPNAQFQEAAGQKRLSKQEQQVKLKAWYTRFGFIETDNGTDMIRTPK